MEKDKCLNLKMNSFQIILDDTSGDIHIHNVYNRSIA